MNDTSPGGIAHYRRHDNVAVITLDAPPVNGLGLPVRAAIERGFQRALADSEVEAIVITAAGKLFSGGADITEFGTERAAAAPVLPDLCDALEASTKPVVAAINGMALGGGCELALACDYRIAVPAAQIGLPEVKLGLLPGAGGTQRLPRLVGAELAVEMITSGEALSAARLHPAGLIDRLHEDADTLTGAAIAYAGELAAQRAPLRSCADIEVDTATLPEDFFTTFRAGIARRSRGFFAPERCIQCVEAACTLPLAQGLQRERQLFQECMATPQARAQQHLFFAQRAATRIPGVSSRTLSRRIDRVAVIGAGTMGSGIAMNFLNCGIPTVMLDVGAEAVQRGRERIRASYEASASRGRLESRQVAERMALLSTATRYDAVREADLVIEAVFEDMALKRDIFATLDAFCKPGAILATNTSTLDVDEIAAATRRPGDVIGLHFFSPANVMRLVEIVRGARTADEVLVTAIRTAQRIAKVPVVSGVCWGFIGNRGMEPYGREAARLVLEGASPARIESVLQDFGLAMGFPSMIDLAGIDVGYLTRQGNRDAFYPRDASYHALCDRLYQLGRYGQKSGRGFYRYEGRERFEDPEVEELARALAAEHGITRRDISDREILERTLYVIINEGAHILEEGIALRAGDIDTVYCHGYGFPEHRGGPMQYADEIGPDVVLATLQKYRQRLGAYGDTWFRPAPLLEQLVRDGRRFADLDA